MPFELPPAQKKENLKIACKGRNVLFVVDDAWDRQVLSQLRVIDHEGSNSKLLVSTRIRGIIDDAEVIDAQLPSMDDAITLLLGSAEMNADGAQHRREAAQLVTMCNRLPLALGIAGKLLKDLKLREADSWGGAVSMIEEAMNETEQRRTIEESVILASLRSLPQEARQMFHALGISAEDADLSLEAVTLLYGASLVGRGLAPTAGSGSSARTMTIAKARRLIKTLLDFSLINGTIDHFKIHDIVLECSRSCYSPRQAVLAHTALVESLRGHRPAEIHGWLFADHPLTAFVQRWAAHHMRAALGDSLADGTWITNEVAIGWLSAGVTGVIDTLCHAAGMALGVEKTTQLAQQAAAAGDHWTAAIRWAVVAQIRKDEHGRTAPYVAALEVQIEVIQQIVVCDDGDDDSAAMPSSVERDRLYLRALTNILKTWDGELMARYIPHLGSLQQNSDAVDVVSQEDDVVSEDPALRCLVAFISFLPSWNSGDLDGWAAGLWTVWKVCMQAVDMAANSQKPLIYQFACGMCFMFSHGTMILEQLAVAAEEFDWEFVRMVMDRTAETYSYSVHSSAITELGSVNYVPMGACVWPVVAHYGNLQSASTCCDAIIADIGRLVDAANPEDSHTRIFCACSIPWVLFCIGRAELAASLLTRTMGMDIAASDESMSLAIGRHAMYNPTQSLTYVKLELLLVDRSLSAEQVTKLLSTLPTTPHDFAMQSLDLPMETTMPMFNVHCHVAPCALAALVLYKLGMDDLALAYADECLLGDQSRGGDSIASTRIFALMVRAQIFARRMTDAAMHDEGEAVKVDAAFGEAAAIAGRIGLRLYQIFALHAWRMVLHERNSLQGPPSQRLRQEVEAKWTSTCGDMESTEELFDELAKQVWRPIGTT
jgi:hypothetical protein